jgi:hypothetical protein
MKTSFDPILVIPAQAGILSVALDAGLRWWDG